MNEYRDRINRAIKSIESLITIKTPNVADKNQDEITRLMGKVEGLKLALSYLDDELKMSSSHIL